ncbi:MAG: hypothetical protein LBM38_04380 [Clostridiales bacterium]|nr:hypothetical protein [Clostridiales bacterium]
MLNKYVKNTIISIVAVIFLSLAVYKVPYWLKLATLNVGSSITIYQNDIMPTYGGRATTESYINIYLNSKKAKSVSLAHTFKNLQKPFENSTSIHASKRVGLSDEDITNINSVINELKNNGEAYQNTLLNDVINNRMTILAENNNDSMNYLSENDYYVVKYRFNKYTIFKGELFDKIDSVYDSVQTTLEANEFLEDIK